MDDSKRKGKQTVETSTTNTQQISDDQTPPASTHHPTSPNLQPSSSSTAPSSSSQPALVQQTEAERLNLTTPKDDDLRRTTTQETSTTNDQQLSDGQTPPASPHHRSSPLPQPSSSSSPSSPSQPALVQEIEAVRLNRMMPKDDDAPQRTTQETPSPSSPRIPLSSIPRAASRPFFNRPTSGSQPPPHPQQSQMSIVTTAVAAAMSSSGSVFSHEQNLAAKLRMMKPADRSDFRLSSHLGKKICRKKRRREGDKSEAGRTRVTRIRPGSSPLGPDLTPYQKVQKCLAQLKDYIKTLAELRPSDEAPQPGPQPLPDPSIPHATSSSSSGPIAPTVADHIHAASSSSFEVDVGLLAQPLPHPLVVPTKAHPTSSSSGPNAPPPTTGTHAASSSSTKAVSALQAGCSSSAAMEGEWTVEKVIGILEEFLKRVPMTIGAQEMENGLWEIQTRLGVDPTPTWYALMCTSYEHMWESLSDYFDCDALDKSLEDVLEEDPLCL